jgi:hypothetical protein
VAFQKHVLPIQIFTHTAWARNEYG